MAGQGGDGKRSSPSRNKGGSSSASKSKSGSSPRRKQRSETTDPFRLPVDLKGNPVWSLRKVDVARDLPYFVEHVMVGGSEDLTRSIMEAGEMACCVAEAQILDKFASSSTPPNPTARPPKPEGQSDASSSAEPKGTEEGQSAGSSSSAKIVGCTLCNVESFFARPPAGGEDKQDQNPPPATLVKTGELMKVHVDPRLAALAEDVQKKLILATLKRMKTHGVATVSRTLPSGSPEIDLFLSMGFKLKSPNSKSERKELFVDLNTINPDPSKKID
eukprot:CAMPEP_0184682952 /NCGR_PEP_ID=MMETSP0312-20130426/9350_1 /TAXON_ID=31354 /ORGANISM="Compsopogon coeruleus, Strain SAG 36.94" /LENGTH=273 /DNA_ID=CAMNT_0027134945 /DNA_START=138 /DNA_END=959 /DNA_ORIENTATION=+